MADKLELDIVTPERRVLAEEVAEVVLPSAEGSMGVRPGHAPLMARLMVGTVAYRDGAGEHLIAVSGGYAEVLRTGVTILATTAERADEIDVERAQKAQARAEQRLQANASDVDLARAQASLSRALNRISLGSPGRV